MSRLAALLSMTLISVNGYTQSFPRLDVQKVRLDIKNNCFSDLDLIEHIDERPIEIFYSKPYALVHVEYRTEGGEAFMKQSTALIYELEDNAWMCLRSVPYNYSIKQLEEDNMLFISDNFICDQVGSCGRYIEVQKLDQGNLKVLEEFEGFSNYAYWSGLLSREEEEQLREAIGDTIEVDFEILDYEVTKSNGLSLRLKKSIKVLKGFDEYDVNTSDTETITTIEVEK